MQFLKILIYNLKIKVLILYKYFMNFTNKEFKYRELLKEGKELLQSINYTGEVFRTAYFWKHLLNVNKDDCVKYLEIGAFKGANAITFAYLYPNSEIHCVDPWLDYNDYPEYKGQQNENYKTFLTNIIHSKKSDKFNIHKDFSFNKLVELQRNYFDVIYIDGNHEPEYVLEDAVLSFRLLKNEGYMIFDDYGWENVHIGVDAFIKTYKSKLKFIDCVNCQVIVQKIQD
jgi:hypothetical protein